MVPRCLSVCLVALDNSTIMMYVGFVLLLGFRDVSFEQQRAYRKRVGRYPE